MLVSQLQGPDREQPGLHRLGAKVSG